MNSCEYCGTDFNGHGNRRYCSQECSTEAGRIRNRDKYWLDGKDRKYLSWPADTTAKEYKVWYSYGLYLQEYEAMMDQGCAICGVVATVLDHDHKTGTPRAALCHKCNIAVGFFEIEHADKIQKYLLDWR